MINKVLLDKESQGPDGFTAVLSLAFQESLIIILLKQFKTIGMEVIFLNSFYDASITLISKEENDTTEKEKYCPLSLMNRDKNPQQSAS